MIRVNFAKTGHCPYRDPVTLRHSTMESFLLASFEDGQSTCSLLVLFLWALGILHLFFPLLLQKLLLEVFIFSSILCFPKISKPSNKILPEVENKCLFFHFLIEISSSLFQFFCICSCESNKNIWGLSLLDVSSPLCLVSLSKLMESLFLFPPAEIQS